IGITARPLASRWNTWEATGALVLNCWAAGPPPPMPPMPPNWASAWGGPASPRTANPVRASAMRDEKGLLEQSSEAANGRERNRERDMAVSSPERGKTLGRGSGVLQRDAHRMCHLLSHTLIRPPTQPSPTEGGGLELLSLPPSRRRARIPFPPPF